MRGSRSMAGNSWDESHREAVWKGEEYYIDPETGNYVFTEIAHLNRGECCGNRCRHCPYNHRNVPTSDAKEERK